MTKVKLTEPIVIYITMFVMGGCGLAYEYTLSKMSSDILGNSVQQWAIIIGVMMFFMGIGSDLQKYLTNKGLFDKFIVFEILLGLLGGIGPICILYSYGNLNAHFVIIQYFFIASIGLLIGLEIPLLTRINETYTHALRYNIGGILKMDYIGALCGALVWVFVLPKFFTLVQTSLVLGILTVLTAGFALFYFRKLILFFFPLCSFCALSLVFLSFSLANAKDLTSFAEQYLYRDRIVFSKTTRYQHIVLTQSRTSEISCYINGHLQFNSSDEFIYHELLVHPAMLIAPRRKKVLVLGGGDGLAVREIVKFPEVESITLVDIDPQMTQLAQRNPYFLEMNQNSLTNAKVKIVDNHALTDAGTEDIVVSNQKSKYRQPEGRTATVTIVNIDAAKFIEQVPGRFDVIIIDFPDPNSRELAKLYSSLFYSRVKDKLSADGVFVQQSTSPVHAREAFLCIGRTMREVGLEVVAYHDNVPSFGEWGWWIGGHADRNSPQQLKQRLSSVPSVAASTRYLTPEIIRSALVFGKGQLITERRDVTTSTNSRVYDYYLEGWMHNY
jgi:spermidine synthase